MNLQEAVNQYLGQTVKATTRQTHYYALRHLIGQIGPDRSITGIAPMDISRWESALIARDELSEASHNRYRTSVRAFFNWLVKMEALEKSPARNMKIKRAKTVPREKAMPDDKLAVLLKFIQWKKRKRDHALILFLADTGCRIGEAATLTVDNLDIDKRQAFVTGKTGGRMVPFGDEAARIIRRWLVQRKPRGPYVFSETIKPQSNLDQQFRRQCEAAGIGSWGPHSLRHRKGFQYSDAGVSAKLAQQQFGHSSVQITLDHYYPQDFKRVKEAADRFTIRTARTPQPVNIRDLRRVR